MGRLSVWLMIGSTVVIGIGLTACASSPPQLTTAPTEIPSQPPAPPEPTDADAVAVVSIASVDVDGTNMTVAGFVTQVAEDGGACRYVLTSEVSGAEVFVESVGLANVDTTSCGTQQVAVAQLSRGPWQVVLGYVSESTSAVSDPVLVDVP